MITTHSRGRSHHDTCWDGGIVVPLDGRSCSFRVRRRHPQHYADSEMGISVRCGTNRVSDCDITWHLKSGPGLRRVSIPYKLVIFGADLSSPPTFPTGFVSHGINENPKSLSAACSGTTPPSASIMWEIRHVRSPPFGKSRADLSRGSLTSFPSVVVHVRLPTCYVKSETLFPPQTKRGVTRLRYSRRRRLPCIRIPLLHAPLSTNPFRHLQVTQRH